MPKAKARPKAKAKPPKAKAKRAKPSKAQAESAEESGPPTFLCQSKSLLQQTSRNHSSLIFTRSLGVPRKLPRLASKFNSHGLPRGNRLKIARLKFWIVS